MTAVRCAVWARDDQGPLLHNAFDGEQLSCVAAGCPGSSAAETLCEDFGAHRVDDVRQMLHEKDVDVHWLAAPHLLDADLRSAVRTASAPVATSAPCREGFDPRLYGEAHALFIPLLRAGPTFHAAAGCMEHLGVVHCLQVSASAGDHQTSLGALMLDCADLVVHLAGMPDEVFAGHAGGPPLTADPGASITGHVTATMRFPSGAAASITVSDGGGTWVRRATVLGEGGRVILTDEGVSWTDPGGRAQEAPPTESNATAGALARWHLLRLGQATAPAQPGPEAALLCEAMRLSCVTGQIEEPGHLAQMFPG